MNLIGSKEGLAHIIFAYIEPGDVVLCPSPGYPVYENFTYLSGGVPYTMPLRADNNFLPDLDAIPPGHRPAGQADVPQLSEQPDGRA